VQWLWWRPPCVLRTVVVQLVHDDTLAIEGVLWAVRGPWFTIARARLLKAGLEPSRVDGEVILHRSNVAFVQVVPTVPD
jgi:hypothetical protein